MLAHNEIERRFLVDQIPDFLDSTPSIFVQQCYLMNDHMIEVRIRNIDDSEYWLSVKIGNGLSRPEMEKMISQESYDSLFPMTIGKRISKRIKKYKTDRHIFEFHEYTDMALKGLIVMEVELPSVDFDIIIPKEISVVAELTGDLRFSNKNLVLISTRDECNTILSNYGRIL